MDLLTSTRLVWWLRGTPKTLDTFSPIVKMNSIRVLFALAAQYDLDILQIYVKTVLLRGDREEEIYIRQPEGFVQQGKEHLLCKLHESLYGFKQACRAWYNKIDTYFLQLWVTKCSNGYQK